MPAKQLLIENQDFAAAPSSLHASLMQTVFNVFLKGPKLQNLEAACLDREGRLRRFTYGYMKGIDERPLVVVIPGFGCPYNEGTACYLSQLLNDQGYHVVTTNSPSSEYFMIHSHHSGIPGVTTEDTRDALMGISAIRDQLQSRGVKFNKIHLVGYSIGALNAAFARTIDRAGENMFEKVILINPPVDMAHGMRQLDSFLKANEMSGVERARTLAKAAVFIFAFGRLHMTQERRSELFFANNYWTERELSAVIGFSFKKTVRGGVQAALRLGHLKANHTVSNFTQYCETATVSHYQKFRPGATSRDLFHHESILKIAAELASDDSVRVLHNQNDFLLAQGDVGWLQQHFGRRAHIFSWGGHLGNIWHGEFHIRLAAAFEDHI